MATKATEEQVRKLETEHKTQFINLVLANRLFIKLLPKIHGKAKTSKEYLAVVALGKNIAKNALKWYNRQVDFEKKAKIPKVGLDLMQYFLNPKTELKLLAQAQSYLKTGVPENNIIPTTGIAGIGIIPLLIWAAILIIGALSAVAIVDELNTTAEEKADLMKQTEATLKDLNITGPQAAAVISQTQEQASESNSGGGLLSSLTGGGTGKLLLYGGLAYLFLSKNGVSQAKEKYSNIKRQIKKK